MRGIPASHIEDSGWNTNNNEQMWSSRMTVECVLESCISADRASAARLDLPCQAADADLWFAEDPRDLERAKELCAQCPLRAQCLQAALDRAEPWGVWGGEIFERGAVIARKRPRGRPRKTAA